MTEPYVCTLDEASQKKALEELGEDPKNRQGAIDTFREWILQQKHLKSPTGNVFLLAFLRAQKFSQLEARRQLEKFLNLQSQKLPLWYKDYDTANPESMAVLNEAGVLLLPGRDKEGRKVFLMQPATMDTKFRNYSKVDVFRTLGTVMDYLYLIDEATQVNGTVTIIDFTKFSMQHQMAFSLDDIKNFGNSWHSCYPARVKAIHMYKLGPFMEFIMTIMKVAMPEKIQKRVFLHGTSLESLYQHIPLEMLPEDYLPDDYKGPTAGTPQSILANMKTEFTKPEIREQLKHISSKEFTINMKEKDTDVPQASFRKLNID